MFACACAPSGYPAATPNWVNDTASVRPSFPTPIADRYRDVAAKIIATARADRGAYAKLEVITDTIGARLAGSPALDKAIAWAAQAMKDDGLEVRTEKVMVPHWVRGEADGAITAPIARRVGVLALGGSVSTPKGGITAPVVVVHNWKELDAKADQVKGAIVVYNVPLPAYSEETGSGYGHTVQYRGGGASQAAKRGAVAALVRSVTAKSLHTLHTGAMRYDKDQPKIPTASITIEDAELLDRLAAKGTVTMRLRIETQELPEAESANVIGEIKGREKPDEVVVISGHIDSWDVGQGAHDDGAGIVTMMQAGKVLKELGLVPRRTIRIVLFTNEENGLRGGRGYAAAHQAELDKTVFALESDFGGFAPRGFGIGHKDKDALGRMQTRMTDIASLLRGFGASRVTPNGHGGADIEPMAAAGVPQVGLDVDGHDYFDYHHTDADTLDKVKPQDIADMVAAVAVMAYVVADMPDRVDSP